MPTLTRREFHACVVAGGAALMLPSCSAFDGKVGLTGGQAVLPLSQFPALATTGGSAVVEVEGSFPIVVVRTGDAAAVALSATCTHEACIMRYAPTGNDIHCDCHNANFSLTGAVMRGPTTIPIPAYQATVGADAITVDIST